jgi:hypothetical protein
MALISRNALFLMANMSRLLNLFPQFSASAMKRRFQLQQTTEAWLDSPHEKEKYRPVWTAIAELVGNSQVDTQGLRYMLQFYKSIANST